MRYIAPLIAFMLLTLTYGHGQSKIVLQHKRLNSQKVLDLERVYTVKTKDSTYYSKIIDFSDSTLSVIGLVKSNRDTTYAYTYHNKVSRKDTTIMKVKPVYVHDTIVVKLKDIQLLKREWFKKQGWLAPFVVIAYVGVMGLKFSPGKTDKEVTGFFIVEGILFAVSIPPILIGTGNTKYDLINNWTIKMEK
jgi:hypothetical protein